MHRANWASQSASSGSSSPSPRLTNSLRPYGEQKTDAADLLGTKDVFREVVKGRKSWKTLKGGEMVWPPELEAALLEGTSISICPCLQLFSLSIPQASPVTNQMTLGKPDYLVGE